MSEEKIIEILKEYSAANPFQNDMFYKAKLENAIEGLLDLYKKEKEKNASLQKEIRLMKSININDNYIHKDKIKEIIKKYGYGDFTVQKIIELLEG